MNTKISSPLRKFSQVFDNNKDDKIPMSLKNERSRQRPFDEELQARSEWMSQNWRTYFAQPSSSSSSSQHEHDKTVNGKNWEVTDGKIMVGEV